MGRHPGFLLRGGAVGGGGAAEGGLEDRAVGGAAGRCAPPFGRRPREGSAGGLV